MLKLYVFYYEVGYYYYKVGAPNKRAWERAPDSGLKPH